MNADALATLPLSPEFKISDALIRHLKADALLAPYVFEEVWDRADQAQALATAARTPRGVVAVAPQPPRVAPADPNVSTGLLMAQVAVCVFTARAGTGGMSAAAAAALLAATLRRVMRFDVDSAGVPYAEATIDSVGALNAADFPELKNLAGMVISVSIPTNYKTN